MLTTILMERLLKFSCSVICFNPLHLKPSMVLKWSYFFKFGGNAPFCFFSETREVDILGFVLFVCLCSSGAVPAVKHVASLLAGLYGLFLFFEWYMLWVLLLSALCYLVLILSQHSSRRGLFLSVVILIYLLIGYVCIHKLALLKKKIHNQFS